MTQEWKSAFEGQSANLQSCIAVQVKGKKDGQQVQEYVYLSTSESDVREWLRRYGTINCWVPIPAVATAKMLAKGEIATKGVIAPECLEPQPFLRELSKMGLGRFHMITKKQVAA
jgi:saccharopine dehydrogenase-like NADP-dependent oxidoreductase